MSVVRCAETRGDDGPSGHGTLRGLDDGRDGMACGDYSRSHEPFAPGNLQHRTRTARSPTRIEREAADGCCHRACCPHDRHSPSGGPASSLRGVYGADAACLVQSCRHGGRLSWHVRRPQAATRRDKTTRTRVPRRASMSISASVLNRSMRPRRRSLIGVLTRPCTRRRLAQ